MSNQEAQKVNIAGLYNRVAPTYGQVGPQAFTYVGRQLVERIGISEGAQVLDVGTGRGANLFAAAAKVGSQGHVIGIDLAESMVLETTAEVKRRNLSTATVCQMDAEQLAFDAASFDFALCGFAIFLFPHLDRVLAEIARVLLPGGKLGITVARNPDPLSQWYGKHITEYHDLYHFPLSVGGGEGSNYADLPLHLAQAGFTDVQVLHEETEFVYADAQQWWDSKWTHGTRYSLEHMTPEVLAQFKSEVFAKLSGETQSDGIHEEWHIQYILANRN